VTVASDQVRPSSDSARVTVVVVPVESLVDVESPVILLPLLVPLWVPDEVSVSASLPSVASLTLRVCDEEKLVELVRSLTFYCHHRPTVMVFYRTIRITFSL
jgi:hypothetical protein